MYSMMEGEDEGSMKVKMIKLVRSYIENHYAGYAKGELSLRKLKTFLSMRLEVPYSAFQEETLGAALEDEVEEITQRCDEGRITDAKCIYRIGTSAYKSRKSNLDEGGMSTYASVVIPILLILAAAFWLWKRKSKKSGEKQSSQTTTRKENRKTE